MVVHESEAAARVCAVRLAKNEASRSPLAEQERIVRLLDEANTTRKLRAKADQRTADLIPAFFHEMFGDPVSNPIAWETAPLMALGTIQTGSTPSTKREDFYGGPIPCIRPENLDAFNDVIDAKTTLTEIGARAGTTVSSSTVLTTFIGQIGKVGITRRRVAFNQQINAIEFGKRVIPEYGASCIWALRSIFQARASHALVPILNKSNLSKMEIPVPPFNFQEEFVRDVASVRNI